MRAFCAVVAVLAATMAMPVSANGWRQGFVQAQMQRHPDRFQRQPQRDFRSPPQQQDRGPRDGRMTEQERRDLHRDLDRANRELYKGRR